MSVQKENVSTVVVHILATFNNTIVTACNPQGQVLAWSSAGQCGFKGSRKSTPFAAGVAAGKVLEKLRVRYKKIKFMEVFLSGPGAGREPAVRNLRDPEITITKLVDVTPIAHGGCRPPKERRV